jgi:hypothetical protein
MQVLLGFPEIVKQYAGYYSSCFSKEGFTHFQKAVSGFLVSENKTLEKINQLFVQDVRNQSSFNRFFNRQSFVLWEVNRARLSMLQSNEATSFKTEGVLSIDSSLLKHYGTHFANIYYHYDYVDKCYRWAHDLVSLYYSDSQTDYPVYYQLWEPPDWEAVAEYFRSVGVQINEEKWASRHQASQKWRNYIRSRYRDQRRKFPSVVEIYRTKNHIARELLEQFCAHYPDKRLPVALDSGFSSAELCEAICDELKLDYVASLKEKQLIRDKDQQGKWVSLAQVVEELRHPEAAPNSHKQIQKLRFGFRSEAKEAYAFFGNYRIKGYKHKQRLVISFLREDLSDRPTFTISNRLDWYPSGILRIRRHRWPIETYHQEAKAEGLQAYQVRNDKAIQTYICLVIVAFSMLKASLHNPSLLSSIQQRLQTEMDSTLPFLRRLISTEALCLLVQYVHNMTHLGHSWSEIFASIAPQIT